MQFRSLAHNVKNKRWWRMRFSRFRHYCLLIVSTSCGLEKIIYFLFVYYVYYTLLCRIILKDRNYERFICK